MCEYCNENTFDMHQLGCPMFRGTIIVERSNATFIINEYMDGQEMNIKFRGEK